MEVSRPGLVSRPDFMGLGLGFGLGLGLGLVSQRSRSRGSKVSVSLETSLSRPERRKNGKKETRIKHSVGSTQPDYYFQSTPAADE